MSATSTPSFGFAVETALYDGSVIEAEFLRRWTGGGSVRFLRSAELEHIGEISDLLPEHSEVLLACRKDGSSNVLATSQDTIVLLAGRSTSVTAQVAGVTDDLAASVLAAISAQRVDTTDDGEVRTAIWHHSARGTTCAFRRLEAPTWHQIARNYPAAPRGLLDRTMRLDSGSYADQLHADLRELSGVDWVTAGKLMAAKRPALIPVYDSKVRGVAEPVGWTLLRAATRGPVRRRPPQHDRRRLQHRSRPRDPPSADRCRPLDGGHSQLTSFALPCTGLNGASGSCDVRRRRS